MGVSCETGASSDLDGVAGSCAVAPNMKPELALGGAVNMPALACSFSALFAGWGVPKPLNKFVFGASGAWKKDVLAGFSLATASLAPNMLLKSGAEVLAGLGSPPKGLWLFGVSEAALLAGSAGFALLKKFGVAGVGSCALVVSCVWPKLNFGVLSAAGAAGFGVACDPKVNLDGESCAAGASCVCPKLNLGVLDSAGFCRPEKRLLDGAGAGVLEPPNIFVAGAGVAGSAGFGVAALPKVKSDAGAAAGVLSLC